MATMGNITMRIDPFFTQTRIERCNLIECILNNDGRCNLKQVWLNEKGTCYDCKKESEGDSK